MPPAHYTEAMRRQRSVSPPPVFWLPLALVALGACSAAAVPATAAASAAEASAESAEPLVVEIEPSRDVTLIESADGSLANGEGSNLFVGRTGQASDSRRRALLAFDVAAALPAGAEVVSATLTLSLEHTHAGLEPIELRRPLTDWDEGPSTTPGGRGAPSEPGDVTWLHRAYPDVEWRRPGGDFGDEVVAVAAVSDEGRYVWGPTAAMTADVRSWLERPRANRGWLLLGNEEEAGTAKSFASGESEREADRPKLSVTYRPSR